MFQTETVPREMAARIDWGLIGFMLGAYDHALFNNIKHMAKTDSEKIIDILEKSGIDKAIETYAVIKNWLTAKIVEKANEHEEAQNKYLSIKDTISK